MRGCALSFFAFTALFALAFNEARGDSLTPSLWHHSLAPDERAEDIWRVGQTRGEPKPAAQPVAPAPVVAKPVEPVPPPTPIVVQPEPVVRVSKNFVAMDLGRVAVFEFNSAKLDPASEARLRSLVKGLVKTSSRWKSIEVAGHSDARGSAAANKEISAKRAQSVRSILIEGGIDQSRIVAKGYGQEQPLAGVDAADGSQRRVELRFMGVEENDMVPLANELKSDAS